MLVCVVCWWLVGCYYIYLFCDNDCWGEVMLLLVDWMGGVGCGLGCVVG